jgi:AcrR family transcriptional regulator
MKNHETVDMGETRQTIIQTAHKLFMELGYRAVSTRQIADACGVTQPALYHHFKNKQTLYIEVILTELHKTKNNLERIIKRHKDIKERLIGVANYILVNKPEEMHQMFRDIQQELSPEARELISNSWFDSFITPLAEIFKQGIQDGKIRSPEVFGTDPINSSFLLLNMLSHSPAQAAGASPQEQKKIYDQHVQMLVNVLLYGLAPEGKKNISLYIFLQHTYHLISF